MIFAFSFLFFNFKLSRFFISKNQRLSAHTSYRVFVKKGCYTELIHILIIIKYNRVCGASEMAGHVFLSCPSLVSLWSLLKLWIGVAYVDPDHLHDHFVRFVHSSGGLLARRSCMQFLWLCCVWVLWIERSDKSNNVDLRGQDFIQ